MNGVNFLQVSPRQVEVVTERSGKIARSSSSGRVVVMGEWVESILLFVRVEILGREIGE